jgi:hypothetical protein
VDVEFGIPIKLSTSLLPEFFFLTVLESYSFCVYDTLNFLAKGCWDIATKKLFFIFFRSLLPSKHSKSCLSHARFSCVFIEKKPAEKCE